jgi:dihydroorotate dehydrogenase (NAD+) catalytic subunit
MPSSIAQKIQTYDTSQTYDWNYANAPDARWEGEIAAMAGEWDFCGLRVNSPLGMPAGPLLNSSWILQYASLGFDVLTYKTVRSVERLCYEPPNLLPVSAGQLTGSCDVVSAADNAGVTRSWAISFGMPSKMPAIWRADVERARKGLRSGQILSVSVVASPEADWSLDQIAADFAQCTEWAREAGADVVEANLSCPNVCTSEGQLYTSPKASRLVAAAIRSAARNIPIVLKIGLFQSGADAEAFLDAVAGFVDALSTTNSISAAVSDGDRPLFNGLTRGIGGECIRDRCQAEVEVLKNLVMKKQLPLRIIGVGGVSSAADVTQRIAAGAHHVQIATAAMLDPFVAVRIRRVSVYERSFEGGLKTFDAEAGS